MLELRRILLLIVFVCAVTAPCHCRAQRILCRDGFGGFSSKFSTGVTVIVGAARDGGFATHACDATLQWGKNELSVVRGAWGIDIDVMGANLGLGVPVVAFRIENSELNRLATYEVFSLVKPPHLLRTITGGDEYDAKDMDLRGRNEIWIDDARAIDGFENLSLSSWDFAPTVVFRFKGQRLVDVGSEFEKYFDSQVAQVKSQLDATALDEFRNSDGRPSASSTAAMADLHMLVRTKIQVLEIVWAYLDSGREQKAWSELTAKWPPADLNRIRSEIQNARARGVLRETDGVAKRKPAVRWTHHAEIFDCNDVYEVEHDSPFPVLHGSVLQTAEPPAALVDSRPRPIYLGLTYPRSQNQGLPDSTSKIYLNLVIDEAGKVERAELANIAESRPVADKVLGAATEWNFIPAFVGNHPVACRLRFGVWPKQ